MPVAARRSRNAAYASGFGAGARHVRGLCVNSWTNSAPISTARSSALDSPEQWARGASAYDRA